MSRARKLYTYTYINIYTHTCTSISISMFPCTSICQNHEFPPVFPVATLYHRVYFCLPLFISATPFSNNEWLSLSQCITYLLNPLICNNCPGCSGPILGPAVPLVPASDIKGGSFPSNSCWPCWSKSLGLDKGFSRPDLEEEGMARLMQGWWSIEKSGQENQGAWVLRVPEGM